MTPGQKLLLESLLARLDADAETNRPQFRGIVSDQEREALRSLLEGLDAGTQPSRPPRGPVIPPIRTGGPSGTEPVPTLKTEALRYTESPAPEWTLCLDFGTAKSKAFAATDEEDPELLALPIGKADGDLDGSVHEVSSSIWIDDDGKLFMGAEAVRRGIDYGGSSRDRLDSLKQVISQPNSESDHTQLERELPKEMDPTLTLTFSDAIIIYLAYLTDLATTKLEQQIGTRYVRRRFTLPWWNKEHRQWAGEFLAKGLMQAQLLADTFHGKWRSGIRTDVVQSLLRDAAAYNERLTWLVLTEPEGGVLEALAAASARIWNDSLARNMMLVVDVGAGTTDISLFWVVLRTVSSDQPVQTRDELESLHRAWLIKPCGTAIRTAGDLLDRLLVFEIIKKANLGRNDALKQEVRDELSRKSVRRLKETLFETGEITVVLENKRTVKLTREEFLNLEGVKSFEQQISKEIEKLLAKVHKSWEKTAKYRITLVLAGGGSSLPMIRNLANKRWKIGNREVPCRLAMDVPADVQDRFESEFIREYPRLSVAMGGALQMLLDERNPLCVWHGGTPSGHQAEDGGSFASPS